MSPDEILSHRAHRPWPLPSGAWVQRQDWLNLLFAHWPVEPGALRPLLPPALPLDTYDGAAWVGITPFMLTGLRVRGLPPLPTVSSFPELNVRTYATLDGKPGVFFFSLDAGSLGAVFGARFLYHLPYFYAVERRTRKGDTFTHASERQKRARPAAFAARYRPVSPPRHSQPGSLEHFLTERYCLYAFERGRLFRAEIHHAPWLLQNAQAEIATNTMASAAGIELPRRSPLLHFAAREEVLVWPSERLR